MKLFKIIEAVLFLLPSLALGWESSIVYQDSSSRLVYESDDKGNRIVDVSHAGYKGGTVPLPQIAVAVMLQYQIYEIQRHSKYLLIYQSHFKDYDTFHLILLVRN
jgi:hypothetical protein